MEVEILNEALDVARVKKPSLQLPSWNDPSRPYCTLTRQGLNDLAVAISPRRSRIPNLADPWFES
jgi:hypothetical protein